MNFHDPLTIIGPVAIMTPLLVSVVMSLVARREGSKLPTRALSTLLIATIAAIVTSQFFPDPGAIVLMTAILFFLFAIPVMHVLERSARERLTEDPVRSASLIPRSVTANVPLRARCASFVAALAALCYVITQITSTDQPLTMSLGFTFAAITFFGLYEAWMRQEIFSVRAAGEDDRRRRVRAIFAAQTILALSFLIMAALSVGPWPGLVPLGVTGAILGGTGCAFALSTGIQERYLQAWSIRR